MSEDVKVKKKGRIKYEPEKIIKIKREIRKLLTIDSSITYHEIKKALDNKGLRVSIGKLYQIIIDMKMDMVENKEVWKVLINRIERRKFLENEAMRLYKEARESNKRNEMIKSLHLLKSVMSETDNFLSRFNLLPAIPTRQEIDVKPKTDIIQLIDAILEEEKNEDNVK